VVGAAAREQRAPVAVVEAVGVALVGVQAQEGRAEWAPEQPVPSDPAE
jgi:hypothetical protein